MLYSPAVRVPEFHWNIGPISSMIFPSSEGPSSRNGQYSVYATRSRLIPFPHLDGWVYEPNADISTQNLSAAGRFLGTGGKEAR